MNKLLLIFFACSTGLPVAQAQPYRFERVFDDTYLSSLYSTAAVRDTMGFMWLGSISGLIRYDGHELREYHVEDSRKPARKGRKIHCLYVSRRGDLWIGTHGAGLFRYDPASDRFEQYVHDPADPGSLGDDHIQSVLEDSWGDLWVATEDGLSRRMAGETSFITYRSGSDNQRGLFNNFITRVFERSDGQHWIGSETGLYRVWADAATPGHLVFEHHSLRPPGSDDKHHEFVYQIADCPNDAGALWVTT
ncbi:MAG: hypothetical protein OHK0039_47920 [Bacteroidia bacterium]